MFSFILGFVAVDTFISEQENLCSVAGCWSSCSFLFAHSSWDFVRDKLRSIAELSNLGESGDRSKII